MFNLNRIFACEVYIVLVAFACQVWFMLVAVQFDTGKVSFLYNPYKKRFPTVSSGCCYIDSVKPKLDSQLALRRHILQGGGHNKANVTCDCASWPIPGNLMLLSVSLPKTALTDYWSSFQ